MISAMASGTIIIVECHVFTGFLMPVNLGISPNITKIQVYQKPQHLVSVTILVIQQYHKYSALYGLDMITEGYGKHS